MPNIKDNIALMSNRELKEFLQESSNSGGEAHEVALLEAKERGIRIVAPTALSEHPLILTKVDLTSKDQWDADQHTTDESAPLLYSKRVIYSFSLFFSVLFGAALIVLNLRALKKPEGVVPTISFSIAYLGTVIFLFDFIESNFNTKVPFSNFISFLGAWLILELVWNKYIGKEIKYRKRAIVIPLLIGVTIIAAYLLAIFYGVVSL